MNFRLPWPPTVNTYWRSPNTGPLAGRVLMSRKGRDYRREVGVEVMRQRVPRGTLKGRLSLVVLACPPDKRKRDLSNLLKGLEDSLQAAGVIEDDGDIDDLRIYRGPEVKGGYVDVTLEVIEYHVVQVPLPVISDLAHQALALMGGPRG